MNFERVILKRKQQILVLRLTFHASRQEDFDSLKDEQDTLCSRGFELFVEYTFGTRNPPDNCEENERRIAEFLNFLFDLSKQATKEAGFVNQRIALPYPETAIRADLSFNECVQWLHQDGLRIPKWFVWIVKTKKGTEYLRQMRQRIIKRAHGIDCQLSYSFRLRFFPLALAIGVVLKQRFWKYTKRLHVHRDQVAVEMVEGHCRTRPEAKILMHYGLGHRSGLLKLLFDQGWIRMEQEEI